MTRIAALFERLKQEDRKALITYITAGDPSPDRTVGFAAALERGGADLIELGVPFSDPVADGPVIQRAGDRALRAGTTLRRVLEIATDIRAASQIPLLLFTYLNPVLRYGLANLARDAKASGIDGVLLTDASVEEAGDFTRVMQAAGLDTVFLAAPTSSPRRLKLIAEYSTGFIYLVSRLGVTGEQQSVSATVAPLIEAMRQYTKLPLAVGFGVSRPEHVAEMGRHAEGVVVGSALMSLIEKTPDEQLLESFTRTLKAGFEK